MRLAAFTAGLILGIAPQAAAQALGEYEPAGMRQRVRQANGVTILEDCYNASPDSMRAAIRALRMLDAKRHIAVLGDMLELGSLSGQALRANWSICGAGGRCASFCLWARISQDGAGS